MHRSHLPAGQPMPGPGGAGGVGGNGAATGMDMGSPVNMNGPRGGGGGGGAGNGGGRRPPPQYPPHQYHHQPHHQQHMNPMYHAYNAQPHGYMNPYAPSYYPQIPHHYQNGAMPGAGYMPYQGYARSPPAMHQYPPMMGPGMPQPYSRPPQQPSPSISTPPPPYQPQPPPPIPQTPTSTHSSHVSQATGPVAATPEIPQAKDEPNVPDSALAEPELLRIREPFRPPLPWLSVPGPFPTRSPRSRRRRWISSDAEAVQLPDKDQIDAEVAALSQNQQAPGVAVLQPSQPTPTIAASGGPTSQQPVPSARSDISSAHEQPSEDAISTSPTTPTSVQPAQTTSISQSTPTKVTKPANRPAIPVVPVLPKQSPKDAKSSATPEKPVTDDKQGKEQPLEEKPTNADEGEKDTSGTSAEFAPKPAPARAAPKTWSGLFVNTVTSAAGAGPNGATAMTSAVNGVDSSDASAGNGAIVPPGFAKSNSSSLSEALQAYRVGGGPKLAFVEPRGLINTGNMCYMNSVLQVLIFCIPFYDFLDQISKKAAYSFKSETPLIDAMIMFMREYKVIDSANSVDQLRRRLKNEELEQFGDPFTPEFVYDAIRRLPRFASMIRGHQQDAEEFLGFLLESLHDECAHVMRLNAESGNTTALNSSAATPAVSSPTSTTDPANDWLEVGRRQRAAVTRSSGHPTHSSPITKIFGGQLRSEFRVPGLKDSVTLEPYQPLQLDIGSPQVRNIVDALRGLTRPETLHGDFGSPRGKDVTATKQVFIESLPPVLILHLKRFQFDAEGNGTVKIWKKVGYPLDLEIPKEVFSRQKRNSIVAEGAGAPKYKLVAVVYHHGKNASGGHYTVDVRRQEGREWIRIDDTVIRRVRSEDVAEGGAEEDTSKSSAWSQPDNKKEGAVSSTGNRFEGIGDEETGDEDGWKQVNAPVNGGKKWSSVVNGATGKDGPAKATAKHLKENVRDNRVAYLLFYQRV